MKLSFRLALCAMVWTTAFLALPVFAMEDSSTETNPRDSSGLQQVSTISVKQDSLSASVAAKFCELYQGMVYENVDKNWVFTFGNLSESSIKEFKMNLAFFLKNPTLPFENIHCCFDNYTPKNASQEEMVNWAKKLIQYEGSNTCGLFIYGAVGIGKTHISLAIAKACQKEGEKVLFIQPHEILEREVRGEVKDMWSSCTILIFDDFNGTHAFESDLLFGSLLGAFNKGGVKIFITSNKDYNDFIKRTLVGRKNEEARFKDRTKNIFKVLQVEGESNRNEVGWFEAN